MMEPPMWLLWVALGLIIGPIVLRTVLAILIVLVGMFAMVGLRIINKLTP